MWVSNDYTEKPAAGTNYLKLVNGSNLLRMVGSVENATSCSGMVGWTTNADGERCPHRWRLGEEAPDLQFVDPPKQFVATLVFGYLAGTVQLWDITQKSIREPLLELFHDDDWGDLRGFDVDVIKKGEKLETRYKVLPKPKAKLDAVAKAEVMDKMDKINVLALYDGEDPFAGMGTPKATGGGDPFGGMDEEVPY